MTKKELFKKLIRQNAFWSYDIKNLSDVPDKILIEHTLLFADVDEITALFSIFSKDLIQSVWEEKIVPDKRHDKLNFYLGKFFFNIKNTLEYINAKARSNSRYEKLKQLSKEH